MIPQSLFGGRLLYSIGRTGTGTSTTVPASIAAVVESSAGFTQNFGTSGGVALEFSMGSAATAGGFADHTYIRLGRVPLLSNYEILMSYTNDADEASWCAVGMRTDGTDDNSATDNAALKASNGMYYDEFRMYERNSAGFTSKWSIGTGQTVGGAQTVWCRWRVSGANLAGRTWLDGSPEPNDWDGSSTTDPLATSIPTRGWTTVGIEGGTSGTVAWVLAVHEFHVWDLDRGIGAIAGGPM